MRRILSGRSFEKLSEIFIDEVYPPKIYLTKILAVNVIIVVLPSFTGKLRIYQKLFKWWRVDNLTPLLQHTPDGGKGGRKTASLREEIKFTSLSNHVEIRKL